MTEELISFETAKLAKKKGFMWRSRHAWEYYEFEDKPYGPTAVPLEVNRGYAGMHPVRQTIEREQSFLDKTIPMSNDKLPQWLYARPTQDQLRRWLREKHDIHIVVLPTSGDKPYISYLVGKAVTATNGWAKYKTYEAALEAALLMGLKLIKWPNQEKQ